MLAYGGSVTRFVMTVSIYDNYYVVRQFVVIKSRLLITVSIERGILASHIDDVMTYYISIYHILVIYFTA